MAKTFCSRETCIKCGRCCTQLRAKRLFSKLEDSLIRKAIFEKKGVFYRYNLERYGLGVSGQEAELMQKEAISKNISLKIRPKKIFFGEDNKACAYDYFLDHDSCPFYRDNLCSIYDKRPSRCRAFPKIENADENDLRIFLSKFKSKKLSFQEAVKIAGRKRAG
jgi:Fe-S-cluster containining protein